MMLITKIHSVCAVDGAYGPLEPPSHSGTWSVVSVTVAELFNDNGRNACTYSDGPPHERETRAPRFRLVVIWQGEP